MWIIRFQSEKLRAEYNKSVSLWSCQTERKKQEHCAEHCYLLFIFSVSRHLSPSRRQGGEATQDVVINPWSFD